MVPTAVARWPEFAHRHTRPSFGVAPGVGFDERLEAERVATGQRITALTRRVDGIVEASEWTSHDDEHDPEGVTVAVERAQAQALLAQAEEDLVELDRAAERLRSGAYGRCERCGGEIAVERLEFLPAARLCIACANRRRR
jgi:RNA polymerase-binding transcription factor DksA